MGCPGVAEAAVIGVPHPKWDERPLLIVVRRPEADVTKGDLLKFLDGKIAKWWMPDDVQFIDAIPHGATGKILSSVNLGGLVEASPVVYENTLVVGTRAKKILGLQVS